MQNAIISLFVVVVVVFLAKANCDCNVGINLFQSSFQLWRLYYICCPKSLLQILYFVLVANAFLRVFLRSLLPCIRPNGGPLLLIWYYFVLPHLRQSIKLLVLYMGHTPLRVIFYISLHFSFTLCTYIYQHICSKGNSMNLNLGLLTLDFAYFINVYFLYLNYVRYRHDIQSNYYMFL